jgi:hypothetical protein
MVGLEGALSGDTKVRGLVVRQDGELDTELAKVGRGDLLVEGLGEHVHAEGVLGGVGPQLDLGKNLKV